MAKIAFFELEPWEKDYIKEHLKGHELIFVDDHLDDLNVSKAADCEAIAIFIYSQMTKAILGRLPKLKLITTMSTGFDHIDLEVCKECNITVCNVPTYGENTVAEHTMALLLAISRKIIPSVERTRRSSYDLTNLRGFDLKGKTIGVVGTGKIGKHVIKYAKAFDMKVLAYDKFPDEAFAKEMDYEYVELDKLLSESDVISLHLPFLKETEHIINKKNIRKIKKGCVLINTARGGLVETEALLMGIKEKILKSCGLDVLEEEAAIREEKELLHETFKRAVDLKTMLEGHILLDLDNVYITPHNAFNSTEALQRILDTTINNINSFLSGVPQNTVGK